MRTKLTELQAHLKQPRFLRDGTRTTFSVSIKKARCPQNFSKWATKDTCGRCPMFKNGINCEGEPIA